MNQNQKSTGLVALIAFLVLLAYWPALHAGFIWDDDAYVTDNPLLTMAGGLRQIWFSSHGQSQYFPLVFTTLRFEYAFWGLHAFGYHLVNLLFHGANAWLVWSLLRGLGIPGAGLAAAVFALHPVQVETVAWVTELKNTESTFFYLLTVLAWLAFLDRRKNRTWSWYALALAFHALALFAKTTACTVPAALGLVLWLRKEPINARRVVQIMPFLLLGLAMGALSIWWEGHLGNYSVESGARYGWLDRLLIATRALWFYVGKVVWPHALTFTYPQWQINPRAPDQYIWLFGCVVAATMLWWKHRAIGRPATAGIVFFVAALSPLVGFIWLYTFRYSFVADHYQYLACLGLIAVAVGLLVYGANRWHPQVLPVVSMVLLLTLTFLTWRQSATYLNLETLWRTTLQRNPGSWMAHNNYGEVLRQERRLNEAEAEFHESLRLKPDNAEAWNNLGVVFDMKNQLPEAKTNYLKAIELAPGNSSALGNLASVLASEGRHTEALSYYEKALAAKPNSAMLLGFYGQSFAELGRGEEAVARWREALRLKPDWLPLLNSLALTLATSTNAAVRDGPDALRLAEHASQLAHDRDPNILRTLAAADAETGRFEKAVQTANRALALAGPNEKLAAALRADLADYRARRPHRQ